MGRAAATSTAAASSMGRPVDHDALSSRRLAAFHLLRALTAEGGEAVWVDSEAWVAGGAVGAAIRLCTGTNACDPVEKV